MLPAQEATDFYMLVNLFKCHYLLILFVYISDYMCQQFHHLFHAVTRSLQISMALLRENFLTGLEGRCYSQY